jgi:hypothetical protein
VAQVAIGADAQPTRHVQTRDGRRRRRGRQRLLRQAAAPRVAPAAGRHRVRRVQQPVHLLRLARGRGGERMVARAPVRRSRLIHFKECVQHGYLLVCRKRWPSPAAHPPQPSSTAAPPPWGTTHESVTTLTHAIRGMPSDSHRATHHRRGGHSPCGPKCKPILTWQPSTKPSAPPRPGRSPRAPRGGVCRS